MSEIKLLTGKNLATYILLHIFSSRERIGQMDATVDAIAK